MNTDTLPEPATVTTPAPGAPRSVVERDGRTGLVYWVGRRPPFNEDQPLVARVRWDGTDDLEVVAVAGLTVVGERDWPTHTIHVSYDVEVHDLVSAAGVAAEVAVPNGEVYNLTTEVKT